MLVVSETKVFPMKKNKGILQATKYKYIQQLKKMKKVVK